MFKLLKRRLAAIRETHIGALLLALKNAPNHYLLAGDLGEETGLHSAALPLLARLHKKGLVEPKWIGTDVSPQLGYSLTAEGHDYIQSLPPLKHPDTRAPGNSSLLPKPILSRIVTWFFKTEAS